MSKTDTSEKGLETLIMQHMTGTDGLPGGKSENLAERPHPKGAGWFAGNAAAYDREYAVDVEQLFRFLRCKTLCS
jgi:type I restriction enzyme R subunit